MRESASETIAAFACGFDASRVDPRHVRICGKALADTFAVAIAGGREDCSVKVRRYVEGLSQASGRHSARIEGHATVWGAFSVATVEGAALANGVAAHALDFDDASSPMSGHPSSALFPALLALGESRNIGGARLVAAYLIGFEICCRLGRALDPVHYARGWHMTSSVGTVAAAVACGYLIGMDSTRICHAIGLAVAQTGGSRENFGTDAKPFQIGQCNAAALRAALLAEQGITAAPTALDGPTGYTKLYSNGEGLAGALDGIGEQPLEIERSGIEVKKYPACYAVHRPLDGLFRLMRSSKFSADDVNSVDVVTSSGALALLLPAPPQSGMEAKFSMSYAIATALVDGKIGLSSFTDEAVNRPNVRKLMKRVTARESDGGMLPRFAKITLRLKTGEVVSQRVDALHGSPSSPLSESEFLEKIEDCLSWGGSPIRGNAVMNATANIAKLDVGSLVVALMAPARSARSANGRTL
jgi:2-methylcitrate dehydratase PrpD